MCMQITCTCQNCQSVVCTCKLNLEQQFLTSGTLAVLDLWRKSHDKDSFKKNNLTKDKEEAYSKGHVQVLQDLQRALGDNVLIANNDIVPGVSATMIEGFGADENSIKRLQESSKQGKLVQAHAG